MVRGISRLLVVGLLALTGSMLVVARAHAQFDNPDTDLSVRLGAGVINRASMRAVGDVWLVIGADIKLRGGSLVGGEGELILGVDYYTRSSGGRTATITAVTLSQLFAADPSAKFKGYLGFGAGAYVLKPAGFSYRTVFGGKLIFGYDIEEKIYFEASYHITGRDLDFRGDNTTFLIGYRF